MDHIDVVGVFELTKCGDMVAMTMGEEHVHRDIAPQWLEHCAQVAIAHTGIDEQTMRAAPRTKYMLTLS